MENLQRPSTGTTSAIVLLGIVLLGGIILAGTTLAGQSAQHADSPAGENPGFVVDLHEDGDATITVTYTFDLDEEERAQAFADLEESESEREEFKQAFESRMSTVATNASERVDRSMSVSSVEMNVETVDNTGVVKISVSWHNLAAHSDEKLVVTEPFSSGFMPDRPFYVTIPTGYEVTSVTPDPAATVDQSLVWESGTDLTGYELVLSTTTTDGDSNGDESDDGDGHTDEQSTDGTADDQTQDGEDESEDGETDDGETDGTTGNDDDADGPGFGMVIAILSLCCTLFVLRTRELFR